MKRKLLSLIVLCTTSLASAPPEDVGCDYLPEIETDEAADPALSGSDLIDLESMANDFVLETKRIVIPEYPDAYNPSILRWQGTLLLSFRIYDPKTRFANQIGLIRLDDQMNPAGQPQVLEIRSKDPFAISKRQDPRLVSAGNRLYIVYNNVLQDRRHPEIRRMVVAEVSFDGQNYNAENPDSIVYFDQEIQARSEKNWVPFEYEGQMLFARSINPHWILRPFHGCSSCQTIASSRGRIQWYWGDLRGGTPAFLIDDEEYLAFFHSSTYLPTVHSHGKTVQHYFMGAYTFSRKPPFAITRISSEPIVGKNFYIGQEYTTWKPLRVVFPGGFVLDDRFIWIAYGRQDHEVWIVKIDRKMLLESLVPVLPRG
jgi:predicted GH43/DUF377 family glycosyl hydrolase